MAYMDYNNSGRLSPNSYAFSDLLLCPASDKIIPVIDLNYVYILRCADGSLYTGWTTDLQRRLASHNSGKGAKYTRSRLPVELVYQNDSPVKRMPCAARPASNAYRVLKSWR